MAAFLAGHCAIVDLLLVKGADVNKANVFGCTALHFFQALHGGVQGQSNTSAAATPDHGKQAHTTAKKQGEKTLHCIFLRLCTAPCIRLGCPLSCGAALVLGR